MFWLPDHQTHALYTATHVDSTIEQLSMVLETYLRPPGPLDIRSRLTLTTEDVILVGVAPLPQSVPRLLADALNQMRNVLEHSLKAEVDHRLARGITTDEARAIEVPATGSEEAFDAWTRHKHRKSHGLFARGSDLGERLARLQPWNRKDSDLHPLRRLVAHTNAAKHQAPALTTVRVGKVQLDSAPRDLQETGIGDIGSVIVSVPRGTREGVSVWPQVAVRRPHTGELRTLMWEVREIEEWVRRIALPILIAGRTDLPELRPHLDTNRGYNRAKDAWTAARPMSAAVRANVRMQAIALRSDIADMMVAEDGEESRNAYTKWLETLDDARVVTMFEPLGEAAKGRDFESIARITGQWRVDAGVELGEDNRVPTSQHPR
ncbi:hypothetical protein SAMN05216488_0063 [Microbacterium sp. LKL04]|nr:hypothetical protein SAMN05216488_0063 [Microbacterium sp. LKL04]